MNKEEYFLLNKDIMCNKSVLDLACHDGESTQIIQSLGASHIYAVDIGPFVINEAKKKIQGNVDFFVHDITDYDFLVDLVKKSQTVICLGVFYHLYDHFRFLSKILQPNIDYVLIETVCGPESMNPEMSWGFEPTYADWSRRVDALPVIPHGSPNLSWIVQSADIFGFKFDWIYYYGAADHKELYDITLEEYGAIAGPDWPPYAEIVSNDEIPEFVKHELKQMLKEFPKKHRRMIVRLYNSRTVNSNPLDIQDCYHWPY